MRRSSTRRSPENPRCARGDARDRPLRVILATEAFSRWAPREAECLLIFVEQLAYLGWSESGIRQMLAINPRAFLRLDVAGLPSPSY
jgi:hypothetical protein